MPPFRFGDLPREIRDEIYKQTMTYTDMFPIDFESHLNGNVKGTTTMRVSTGPKKNNSLLLCSRQVKEEYKEELHRQQQRGHHFAFQADYPLNCISTWNPGNPCLADAAGHFLSKTRSITMIRDIKFDYHPNLRHNTAAVKYIEAIESRAELCPVDMIMKIIHRILKVRELWLQLTEQQLNGLSTSHTVTYLKYFGDHFPILEDFNLVLKFPAWCSVLHDKTMREKMFIPSKIVQNFVGVSTRIQGLSFRIEVDGKTYETKLSKNGNRLIDSVVDELEY